MKTLAEMTTGELTTLKTEVTMTVDEVIRLGRSAEIIRELANFRNAIDNELDRRKA